MNRTASKVTCLLLLCSQLANATELDKQLVLDAKRFLTAYLNYTNTRNIDLLKLYSDDGTIKVTVITLDRANKETTFSGQAWKRLLRESWYSGQPAVEPVELHNVSIQDNKTNLEVSAQRYSQTRCYWDNNYKVTFAKNETGEYQITNETLYIDHKNQCQIPDTLTINQDIKINQIQQP
jgi:hypothetical protein